MGGGGFQVGGAMGGAGMGMGPAHFSGNMSVGPAYYQAMGQSPLADYSNFNGSRGIGEFTVFIIFGFFHLLIFKFKTQMELLFLRCASVLWLKAVWGKPRKCRYLNALRWAIKKTSFTLPKNHMRPKFTRSDQAEFLVQIYTE